MSKTVFKSTGAPKSGPRYVQREHSEGAWIFREGDLGTEMYLIQDGQVEILQEGRDDPDSGVPVQEHQLSVLEKGDFFGEMSLLEGRPRAASARALAEVRLVEIDGATFSQMLKDNPEIAVRMMRKLSRRLRLADEQLLALSVQGAVREEAVSQAEVDGEEEGRASEQLHHAKSGIEFTLASGAETSIGRRDAATGIFPHIDLSPLDGQRSISRRHAKIFRKDDQFYLTEEIGTMNGTFVNGERLETGVPVPIRPGDELRFGVIELAFRDTLA